MARSDDRTRRVVLALILREKNRSDRLIVRHDTNTSNLYADQSDPGSFASAARDESRARRAEVDPFGEDDSLDEAEAYQRLRNADDEQINRLIAVLIVETVTANLYRETPLVRALARDSGVNVRRHWRPDATWLNSYKKVQLAHLIGELRGPADESAAERRKKSELVDELARLFTDAAEGRLDDPQLAERVNTWLPANLRDEDEGDEADRNAA